MTYADAGATRATADEPTSEPVRYAGLAGFRYALRRFLAASDAISRQAGVTPQQYQALLAIETWPGEAMAVKDLADQLLLTHHATVQLLDRLTRAGLAKRKASREDRRSVIIRLTPRGETLLSELATQHLEAMLGQEPLLAESLRRLRCLK